MEIATTTAKEVINLGAFEIAALFFLASFCVLGLFTAIIGLMNPSIGTDTAYFLNNYE